MSDIKRLDGSEQFHSDGISIGRALHDFWQWSTSDLRSNAIRGRLAEYIVAMDMKAITGVRREWLSYDLTHPDGPTVEVKSAAYIQSWKQRRPSQIIFAINPTTAWDPDTAQFAPPPARRQAAVYVFALQEEKDVTKMDPLNLAQWRFFVLSTMVLNDRCPTQRTIALRAVLKLSPTEARFGGISAAVLSEAKRAGVDPAGIHLALKSAD